MTPYVLQHGSWEVPSFAHQPLRPRRTKYCVCIPVINEGQRIRTQLESMAPLSNDIDIIVADGGSTDGSLDRPFLERCGVRALLVKTGAGRLSAQMRMALAYAVEEGYAGFIFIDGNNKDDPSAIPRFAAALDQGYDHVQGSRFIPGGRAINTPMYRYLAIRLVHAPLMSLGAGFRYTDTTNGFRAYSAGFITDPRVRPFRSCFADYELHYYLAVRAPRLGFRVTELPVTRAYPATGKTPTKIHPIKGLQNIFVSAMKACMHTWDPDVRA